MSWARLLLLPFSWMYGLGVIIRNKLFDWRILPSASFSLPVVSLGNLSVGGSGKTPHVEFLAELFKSEYKIAILSRGYKRQTKGFVLAGKDSAAREIGDEPLQIYGKYPDVIVAVDERRKRGIRRLLKLYPGLQLIILDDAFQHRYIRPGLNLLLSEYYKPFFSNYLLPAGSLREPRKSAKRADLMIITKTPQVFSPLDQRFFEQKLERYRLKKILFSSLEYKAWRPVYNESPGICEKEIRTIFLLTGIANTSALEEQLKKQCDSLVLFAYRDHHDFSSEDLKKMREAFMSHISRKKVILTTEKDTMRLRKPELEEILRGLPVYYVPVKVFFHGDGKEYLYSMIKNQISSQLDSNGRA